MGTNYYLILTPEKKCEHCGHTEPREELHIGKYSMGWKFCFNKKRFKTRREWFDFLTGSPKNLECIVDEYGKQVTFGELYSLVEDSKQGIWIGDPRYQRTGMFETLDCEYLDPEGYRFSNSEDFS